MPRIRGPCLAIAALFCAFTASASPRNDRPLNNDQPAFTDSKTTVTTAIGANRIDVDLIKNERVTDPAKLPTFATIDDAEDWKPIPVIMAANSTAPPYSGDIALPPPTYPDMLENGADAQEGRWADANTSGSYAARASHRYHGKRSHHKQRHGKRPHHRT